MNSTTPPLMASNGITIPEIDLDASMLNIALTHAKAVPIFPIWWLVERGGQPVCACAQGAACGKDSAKHPLVKWKADATQDPGVIRRWWTNWPEANIGMPTGAASGIDVLDCDVKDAEDDEGLPMVYVGEQELEQWLGRQDGVGTLPDTALTVTQGGGLHVLLAHDTRATSNATGILPAVDRRGDGGYVLLAGSTGISGRYRQRRSGLVARPGLLDPLLASKGTSSHAGGLAGAPSYDYPQAKKTGPGAGSRDDFFNRFAYELRKRDWSREDATEELRRCFGLCDQPSGDRFAWSTVLEKIERVWESIDPASDEGESPALVAWARQLGIGPEGDLMPIHNVKDLRAEDWNPKWLVKRLWPNPGHGMIGGMEKTFKTWLMCIIAVSVASGKNLFNDDRFEVVTSGPVIFFTGESGRHALERRLRRVATKLYGLTDQEYDDLPLYVIDARASLTSEIFTRSLRRHIEVRKPVLVTLDPLYTYVDPKSDAGNIYAMGDALHAVSNVCNELNVSLMVGHHLRKSAAGDVPGLTDLTQAGGREWVEAWVLLNHRRNPEPSAGRSWLFAQVGNRHGFGATLEVDLEVGGFNVDTFDHDDNVHVEARDSTAVDVDELRETARGMQESTWLRELLCVIDKADEPEHTSTRALSRSLLWPRKRVDEIVDLAIHRKYVVASPGPRSSEVRTLTDSGRNHIAIEL